MPLLLGYVSEEVIAANGNAPFWSPYESNSILDLLRKEMEPGARSALAFPRYECGASLTMLTRQEVEARLSIALSNIGFADRGVRLLPRAP